MTSHFKLSYSITEKVIVTVSESMMDKVCGACDKLHPVRDFRELLEETMQQYMASFSAQDFPT
ncbi:IgGFc-binding protein-like protein, partial [Lates japonicus]